jgi:uncharacterized protein YccT (UPF0319 family)
LDPCFSTIKIVTVLGLVALVTRFASVASVLLDASIDAWTQTAAQVLKEGDSLLQKKHTVQLSTRQSEAVVKVDL